MAVVPPSLEIDGVVFRLAASAHGVRIVPDRPGLKALELITDHLLSTRSGHADRRREIAARSSIIVPQILAATYVIAEDTAEDLGDGPANWEQLAGWAASRDDAYLVGATFLRQRLLIPRTIFADLVDRLGALDDEVRAGTREPHLDEPLVDDGTLFWLESQAIALDALDAEARASDPPYADEDQDVRLRDQRGRLLATMAARGLFSHEISVVVRPQLDGMRWLLGYHDAAMSLSRYLASDARARLVPATRPTHVMDADVSLDWFRGDTQPTPPGITRDEWLALCERNFSEPEVAGPRAGRRFVRLEGRMYCLDHRNEGGPRSRLWRATPA